MRQNSTVRRTFPFSGLACVVLCWLMLLAGLTGGCKRKQNETVTNPFSTTENKAAAAGYFRTPFQDESQYIVEAVAADLAEMVFFAQHRLPPNPKFFSVEALEKPGSRNGSPSYTVKITLEKREPLQIDVDVNGPIWSAPVYEGLTSALAKYVGLGPSLQGQKGDTALLQSLTDGLAETVEQENAKLSADLETDFNNPVSHEEAAVLLGAFALREHSGKFFEIRAPLCRATAHLALAHFLNNDNPTGLNGLMAECMLLTLMNNQVEAIGKLGAIEKSDGALTNWVRTLLARNTSDYRPLMTVKDPTMIESIALFQAYSQSVNNDMAWAKLGQLAAASPDCARISEAAGFSVGVGNYLLDAALPFETNEIKSVYKLSQGRELADTELVAALNRPPDRCFTHEEGRPVKVRVIGWGLWALTLQHHFCQALTTVFDVLARHQGLPEEAKKFSDFADQTYDGLRFYPFVRRFNCTEIGPFHKSVDDGFKVTVETPHLTPAQCWNYICFDVSFAPQYRPVSNPHILEWHKYNPPPGTAYDVAARLYLQTLNQNRQRLNEVHEMAPYNTLISWSFVNPAYNKPPTYEEAKSIYEKLLPYSVHAMKIVADTLKADPERYEAMMEKAADLDPTLYDDLGNFAWGLNETNQAIKYYDEGAAKDPDRVRESGFARRRVFYYLKKGETNTARTIADAAAEVYSTYGLAAKGDFHESIGELETALQWYAKIEERYNYSDEVWGFCSRHSQPTGNAAFDQEVQRRLKAWAKIMEKVSLRDFTSPPEDGALITSDSDLLNGAGMKKGDVIVAVAGMRVHNAWQYTTARDLDPDPMLRLIIWQDGHYRELTARPPDHKFGTSINNYNAN